jgi:preprotein translocase subunit SecE
VSKITTYLSEAMTELVHNVSWPTWTELTKSATIVLVSSAIFAILVFLMDFVFGIQSTAGFWKGVLGFIYGTK